MIILDTHAWIWHASAPEKLSEQAKAAIAEATGLGVPAISCWEVAMLVAKRRLSLDRPIRAWLDAALALPNVRLIPLTPSIAVTSTTLDLHGDPADRLIAATALEYRCPLVSRDELLRGSSVVETVW